MEDDFLADPSLKQQEYRNRIVVSRNFWDAPNVTTYRWMEKSCEFAYALIIPYGEWDYGLGYLEFSTTSSFPGVSCRAFTISVASWRNLRDHLPNGTIAVAEIAGDDGPSPVRTWCHSGWLVALSVITSLISCSIAGVGATRLWRYWFVTKSCMPTIPTVCIWFECTSAFLRFLYWALDPFGCRGIVPSIGHQSSFRTSQLPFFIDSTVLLSFYWHETLSRTSLSVSVNLSKFRIPAYIICSLSFLVELVTWLWFWEIIPLFTSAGFIMRSLNQIYYFLVALAMAIFYTVSAIRIFVALKRRWAAATPAPTGSSDRNSSAQISKKDARKNKQIRAITAKLSVSAMALVMFIFLTPMVLAPFYTVPLTHPGYVAFWFIVTAILNLKSISTILAFTPPKLTSSESSTKTGSQQSLSRQKMVSISS